jgi:threonine dehydratase
MSELPAVPPGLPSEELTEPPAGVVDTELIARASVAIRPYVLLTPLRQSEFLSERCGRPVWLKLESHQRTGSFKVRGALARMAALDGLARERGVVTASAGNHGLGVAFASRQLGVPALVVVPETVAQVKLRALRQMLVKVRVAGASYDETEARARELAAESEATFVSAFDDPWVMAGNGGTVGLELREQLGEVPGGVVLPVGGGGLASGLCVALPGVPVLGVNSEASPAMARSLADRRAYLAWPPQLPEGETTLAEGLEGGVSTTSAALCARHLWGMAVVREASIAEAMRLMARREKLVLEGSAATAIAAILEGAALPGEGSLVVVLTGRNVDKPRLEAVLRP